MECTP